MNIEEREHDYIPGDYWMVCDSCGFDYRRSCMKKRWDGLWVCEKDFETRHQQDFIRIRRDKLRVPVARPFIEESYTDLLAQEGEGVPIVDGTEAILDGTEALLDGATLSFVSEWDDNGDNTHSLTGETGTKTARWSTSTITTAHIKMVLVVSTYTSGMVAAIAADSLASLTSLRDRIVSGERFYADSSAKIINPVDYATTVSWSGATGSSSWFGMIGLNFNGTAQLKVYSIPQTTITRDDL